MKKYLSILPLGILCTLMACDDVFEEDITEDQVEVSNPLEGAMIMADSLQFRWGNVQGADSYRIQVMDDRQIIVLDSTVLQPSYIYPISAGAYEWRVRAENFAYVTNFTPFLGFTVVSPNTQ